ncbi:hypothetical protein FPV67DRAFT_1782666 [Lyophyllum atratum]|nr:hypothetical protein FPV67DRAFT_1782666 [Lyophyllum atratum]
MPSFPWDVLKAETLRTVCKDLGASAATRRKREGMVSFLQDVEARGLTAVLQEGKTVIATDDPGEPVATRIKEAVTMRLPPAQLEKLHEEEVTSTSMIEDEGGSCKCQERWLSPRMRYILMTIAGVASDIILDTGDMDAEEGHIGCTYLSQYIPRDQIPDGQEAVTLWIKGFAAIFSVIYKIFKAKKIPTLTAIEHSLSRLKGDQQKALEVFRDYTDMDLVIEALVYGAKEEWTGDEFLDTYDSYANEWDALSACAEHDLNWTTALVMLSD